jgi:putative ABC transport system permease protein
MRQPAAGEHRLARAAFRLALRLYPAAFRHRFAEEMELTFARDLAAARRSGRAVSVECLTALWDVAGTAARERLAGRPPGAPPLDSGDPVVATLWQDLRYAARIAVRQRLVSFAVVTTTALSVCAVTAVASIVDGALLGQFPLPGADRLVRVSATTPELGVFGVANPLDLEDWRAQQRAFAGLAAVDEWGRGSLLVAGEATSVRVARVTAQFGTVLGVRPALGRLFAAEEYVPGDCRTGQRACPTSAVVLSDRVWRERLGADPRAIGRTVLLDGGSQVVVGVLPPIPASVPGGSADVWVPLVPRPGTFWAERGANWMTVIGRLRPGLSRERGQSDLARISALLAREHPRTNGRRGVAVEPLRDVVVGPVRSMLLLMAAAVGVVLLVACANIGNLLLARAQARRREYGVRAALGGGGRRLVRQVLTESVLLTAAGGVLGAAAAPALVRALLLAYPGTLPRADEITVDARALLVALGCTLAAGILAALPLVRQVRRLDVGRELRGGGRATGARGERRYMGTLVVVQVALSVMLLFGGSVLLKAYRAVSRTAPGFDDRGLLTFRLSPGATRYPDAAGRAQFYEDVLRDLATLPGVRGVAATMFLPFTGPSNGWEDRFVRAGAVADTPESAPIARVDYVSPGFAEAMRVPLRAGRYLGEPDAAPTARAVVVNEAFATRAYPGRSAVGQRLRWEGDWWEIVGVVANTRFAGLWAPPPPAVLFPLQPAAPAPERYVVLRTDQPEHAIAAVRARLRRLDPTLAMQEVATMGARLADVRAPERFRASVLGALSGIALFLSALGIYGTVAYMVGRRSREIGIRMTLGETRASVRTRVIAHAVALATSGVVVGLAGALAGGRWLSTFTIGVEPHDPAALAVTAVFVVALTVLAAAVPAYRASRLDPTIVLRAE